MIHRARFQNFKALKDVEITFDSRLTVLVGPNGSGKTSVLRGIHWLCQLFSEQRIANETSNSIIGLLKTTYSGSGEAQLFEIATQTADGEIGLRFRPSESVAILNSLPGGIRKVTQSHASMFKGDVESAWRVGTENPFDSLLGFAPSDFIQLNAAKLAAPSNTTATPPQMQSDGTGLPSLMAYFKLYDETKYDLIVALFRNVIRQIERVRIDRVPIGGGTLGEGLLFDLPDRKGVVASAMSDGTLYALGLIVKILDPQRPKTLLIDDIDHGFHPKAQLTLVDLLHKLLEEIPDLQIIATSHSPYILDRLAWNEVRVTSLNDDGSAVVAKLEDHPDFERWKDAMTPGEFWSTFYEDWARKVKPAARLAS